MFSLRAPVLIAFVAATFVLIAFVAATFAIATLARPAPADAALSIATTCYAEPRSAGQYDWVLRNLTGGISGSDYPHAYPMAEGKTLWLFQDVFFGSDNDLRGDGFAHNAGWVQDGGCFTGVRGGTARSPRSYVGGDRETALSHWFWPLDGEMASDGYLWVFFAEMRNTRGTGASIGAAPEATWVARIDPHDATVVSFAKAPDSSNRLYGWSVASDRDWTYLHGHCYRQFIPGTYLGHDATCTSFTWLARVPSGRLGDTPQYWNGAGWTVDASASAPVFRRGLANPLSVQRINGQWVSTTKLDDWFGTIVTIDVAPDPWGPWTTVSSATVATRCGAGCNTYGAHLLPWLDTDGSYMIAISHNAWDMRNVAVPNGWIYRPGIVTMTQAPPVDITGSRSGRLVPLAPSRIADTRSGIGVHLGMVRAGEILEVPIAGRGGVAADAVGAVLNIAAVSPRSAGYLTVFPCGTTTPPTSTLNHDVGRTIANGTHVLTGVRGAVCVFASSTTHVIVDVTGAYQAERGAFLHAVTPWRAIDTRATSAVPGGSTQRVRVTGRGGVPDSGVRAVTVNVTAVDPIADGFMTVFPCHEPLPNASSVNYQAGDNRPNGVTVPVASDGTICVFTHARTHLLVDVTAWWGDEAGGVAEMRVPVRALDTRALGDGLEAGETLEVRLGDASLGASGVGAVITVTEPDGAGFITVWPCGRPMPLASVGNFRAGQTVANNVTVAVGADGTLCVYSAAATHLIVDTTVVHR